MILEAGNILPPPCVEANTSIGETPDGRALQVIWDFGMVSNPSEFTAGLIEMNYTAVTINTGDNPCVVLRLAASSVVSNLTDSTIEVLVAIVMPILQVSASASVSTLTRLMA